MWAAAFSYTASEAYAGASLLSRTIRKPRDASGQRSNGADDDSDVKSSKEGLAVRGDHAPEERRGDQATHSCQRAVETRCGTGVTRIDRGEDGGSKRRHGASHADPDHNDGGEHTAPIVGSGIEQSERGETGSDDHRADGER